MAVREEEDLVEVALGRDRADGEMIKGLLESAGIPSILLAGGIDGPLFGVGVLNPAGAPQRVMVHAAQAEAARALLAAEVDAGGQEEDWYESDNVPYADGREPRDYGLIGAYTRIWAWTAGTIALAFGIFLLLRAV